MKNFVNNGKSLEFISPAGGITHGDVFIKNTLAGISISSADENIKFSAETRGIFEIAKDNSDIFEGNDLYYNETLSLLTKTRVGNYYFGTAIEDAGPAETKIKVFFDATVFASQAVLDDSDIINVKDASQLAGALDSTKLYRIVKAIDMGSQSITVPEGGLALAGPNGGRDVAVLFSSANNYTMFISPGTYSGDLILDSCSFNVTGTASKIFNLNNAGNNNAVDINNVNFGQNFGNEATSLGSLSEYRQFFAVASGFFVEDGLTFNETWIGGITIRESIVLGFPAAAVFLKAGTNFTIGTIRTNINFNSVQPTSVLCDFQSSHIIKDGGMSLSDVVTIADNAIPNIPSTDVKAHFRDCSGFRNTYVGGQWEITAEAATIIIAANTPVKVAGVTTYTDLAWFSGDNDNELKYLSDQSIEVGARGILSVSGGNNDQINLFFRKWDDSAGSYIDFQKFQATLNGGLLGTRAELMGIAAYTIMEKNDRLEIWGENITKIANFTVLNGGLVSISERSS